MIRSSKSLLLLFIFTTFVVISALCQIPTKTEDFIGAWQTTSTDSLGLEVTTVAIVVEGYHSDTWFNVKEKRFIRTTGGSWTLKDDKLHISYEYDTEYPSNVGTTSILEFELRGDELIFLATNTKWKRIDDGSPGLLSNAWLITGRERNGSLQSIVPGARKTMKILSGTRFQWIAYNSETGQFFGTGGGTYTTVNGKYIENIDFFSRDGNRVGASLQFDFEIKNEQWHHRGLSSKGNPIYEIWTPRSKL